MSEWQPIETAPKDGSLFVGWSVTIMDEFDEDDRLVRKGVREEAPVILQWLAFKGFEEDGGLIEVPYRGTITNRQFTHWMPLPPKPTV